MIMFPSVKSLMKRCAGALAIAVLVPAAAVAQTSTFNKIAVAGSFNDFDSFTPNMTLVGNNLWQADLTVTSTSFRFKFATENFAFNWGRWNQPHSTLPQSETATPDGGDIYVTNLTGNTQIRFMFDDSTREYAVYLLNNIGTNLLYNPSFEQQGGQSIDAKYWEYFNPNTHGARVANAQRQGSNWNYYVKSGAWLGLIGASWAGSDSGAWWQDVPVEAGVTYEIAAWFNVEGAPNAWQTATDQRLKVEFFDFSRSTILSESSVALDNLTTNWVQRTIQAKAPSGAYWARLVFYAYGLGNVGTLRMDDASIQAVEARRTQDFNDWQSANSDGCYTFAGWEACEGRAVNSYTNGNTVYPLARSGLAFSLTNPTASNDGSYIRSPRFSDGIGGVSFYYRHGDESDQTESPSQPVHFKVQKSVLGDFWVTIAEVSNVINTSFKRFDAYTYETIPHYVRVVHSGGSTNRLIIDDISVALPELEPRLMTFDNWTNAATAGEHFFGGWVLRTGRVDQSVNLSGLGGQISGNAGDSNYLQSPTFSDGYGPISFLYRLGNDSLYTAGFALESSSNGTDWITLDTVTGITNINWVTYNFFALETTPHAIRIRNLSETNISPNNAATIDENFANAPDAPPGWTFEGIGIYTGSGDPPPALRMDSSSSRVITPPLINPTNLSFYTRGQSITPDNTLTVEAYRNSTWQPVTVLSNISNSGVTHSFSIATNTALVRFSFTKNNDGNLALDHVKVTGLGFGANPPPQSLALENVDVSRPEVFRTQDFDTWPTKAGYDSGVTFHQGWTLHELVAVTDTKALEGQAAALARVTGNSGGANYIVDFEGAGETKTAYASGDVTLSGLSWNMTEALIGTSDSDFRTGARSARLRGYGASKIEMLADKPGGLGKIQFSYRRYGTDSQVPWQVQYSVNGGSSWINAGSQFTADGTIRTFEYTANVEGNVRVRVIQATGSGSSNRRMNIDDIVLTGYDTGGGDTVDSSIQSPYLRDGIGSISFHYRHELDSTPPAESVVTLHVQTSPDGSTWTTIATQTVDNADYELFDTYANSTNAHYARIIAVDGTGEAIIDEIAIAIPGPPASILITGYHEPALPFTNDTVALFASLTPLNGARDFAVTSYYRIGTSGAFTAIGMTPIGGNVYQATSSIPAQPSGTIVQYYVSSWFEGAGANLTRPARFPTNAPVTTAFYAIPRAAPGQVWINEVDYAGRYFVFDWDDFSYDITNFSFVELSGRAGVNLNGWRIDLVDGTTTNANNVYGSYGITNFTLANETNGFGFFLLAGEGVGVPPADMLMSTNIDAFMDIYIPGVVRLYNEVGLLEDSWAYGGFVPGYDSIPTADPDDLTTTNLPASSDSVSLVGIGTIGTEFDWGASPTVPTPGGANAGQTFAVAPVISLNTISMTFYYIPGSFNPPSQPLVVSNSGGSAMSYSLSTAAGWLSFTEPTVTNLAPGATRTHQVTASTTGLSGNRTAQITVAGTAANSPLVVNVSLLESGIDSALVYYDFDEGSGTIALNQGSIGSPANGILSNGTWTIEAQGASGNLGDFAYISTVQTARVRTAAPVSNLNKLVSFTVSGWVRPTTTNNPSRPIIGNLAGTNGFQVRTTSNGANLALVSPNGVTSVAAATVSSTNGVLATNEWAFFAVTFDSANTTNNAVVFHRGSRETGAYIASTHARGSLGSSGISGGSLYVGGNGTNAFNGWIDDMRVHTGVLSSASIEAIRQAGAFRLTGIGTAPLIEDQPESLVVPVGVPASFIVGAAGEPFPLYQWRKNGVIINGATADELFISTVTLNDTGSYDVIVYNANGVITSQVATLTVFSGAYFVLQPQSQSAYEGETVTFTGGALPESGTTYQWKFKTNNLAAQTNATLVLTNVTMSMTGTYYLVATYDSSSLTSSGAVLTVIPFVFDGAAGGGIAKPSGSGGVVVQWPSLSNRTYNVLWSSNLLAGTHNFVTIATNLPATPALNTYTDTVHGAKSIGIYRVITAP